MSGVVIQVDSEAARAVALFANVAITNEQRIP